jgi:hypothetical protein
LPDDWVRDMGTQALIKEAHHATQIEAAHLTLDQAECLCNGEVVPEADSDDARELLNYLSAIEFVSEHTSENVDNLQCHRIDAFSYLSSLI